jgi:hypothetical protein
MLTPAVGGRVSAHRPGSQAQAPISDEQIRAEVGDVVLVSGRMPGATRCTPT